MANSICKRELLFTDIQLLNSWAIHFLSVWTVIRVRSFLQSLSVLCKLECRIGSPCLCPAVSCPSDSGTVFGIIRHGQAIDLAPRHTKSNCRAASNFINGILNLKTQTIKQIREFYVRKVNHMEKTSWKQAFQVLSTLGLLSWFNR